MAKDYSALAHELIVNVGGKDNIVSVMNCMTRVRFTLRDESLADDEKVKSIKGVLGVMKKCGQYQCVIGTQVPEVVACIEKELGIAGGNVIEAAAAKASADRKQNGDNLVNRVMKAITACIMPSIGVLAGAGILLGLLAAATSLGLLTKTSGTYIVLRAAANAYFYFMPVIVGFAAGKAFGMNPYLAAVLGAALLHPDFVSAMAGENSLSFLAIPLSVQSYSSTFLPVVCEVFVASKLEKLLKKVLPQVTHLMIVPFLVLTIVSPLTVLVIGPVMNWLSNLVSDGLMFFYNLSPVLMGVFIGAFWQVIVILGILRGISAILINDITVNGYTSIGAIMGLTVWSVAGVGLGYALRIRDKDKRYSALGAFASAMCGITEPVLYTICVPSIKHFMASFIGGGLAGGVAAALGLKLYTFGGDGIFKFAGMISPNGLDNNITVFCITALIAIVASAVISFIVTDPNS